MKSINNNNLADNISINLSLPLALLIQKPDGITVNLYNKLILLLENGLIIKEYTQLYETITQRIPVQYVSRVICERFQSV